MPSPRVLVVAGTHGNEINAPWLMEQWQQQPDLIQTHGCEVLSVIGNPEAYAKGCRYLDRDLNRSFQPGLLQQAGLEQISSSNLDREVKRAFDLVSRYGAEGVEPCGLVVDLHSTTSSMGNSLVVYGRRPADLALAALVQGRLGLPVYLHEADQAQQGFLVESWPCGLVIEVGPVPQMVRHHKILTQTRLALEAVFEACADALAGRARYPRQLVVHRHLGSLDLPRSPSGSPDAFLHPQRQGLDWKPMREADPLFQKADGSCIPYEGADGLVPLFINEAAYAEKAIALSLTFRECWPLSLEWTEAFRSQLSAG